MESLVRILVALVVALTASVATVQSAEASAPLTAVTLGSVHSHEHVEQPHLNSPSPSHHKAEKGHLLGCCHDVVQCNAQDLGQAAGAYRAIRRSSLEMPWPLANFAGDCSFDRAVPIPPPRAASL